MVQKCLYSPDTFTPATVFDKTISTFPCARFANIQSKKDSVQRGLYCALKDGADDIEKCMRSYSDADSYYQANTIFERYNEHPNYVSYIVDGGKNSFDHTFLEIGEFYTSSSKGPNASGVPMMYEWVGRFATGDASDVRTSCDGPAKAATNATVDYCDEKLVNKVLSPPCK